MPAAFPIGRLVIVDAGAGSHEAEENVLRGLNHDADVSSPNDQVAGLGLLDSLKSFDAGVEIRRGRIGVRKSSALVDGMNQMRAVGLRISDFRVERSDN